MLMMKQVIKLLCISPLFFFSCRWGGNEVLSIQNLNASEMQGIKINEDGMKVKSRFAVPEGFKRKSAKPESFAAYLRNLPLKAVGTKVRYYNGEIKNDRAYEAVVDMEIGKQNLQQCADAVMRLRGEYFYSRKAYDSISFKLTNGFEVAYNRWMKGERVMVSNNETWWQKSAEPSNNYQSFRKYMDFVFSYAGTLSLSASLRSKAFKDIAVGDVFIVGGSPGHAVIVVDVAENKSGEKVFMLAQSYMPAQETQILKNLNDPALSPWYKVDDSDVLLTPEWKFGTDELKGW